MSEKIRIEAYFSGYVQGVGFRFTTIEIAERFREVGGFVRNLPDGRVEVAAEGPVEQLSAFLAAVESTMGPYIHHADKAQLPATGEFSGFTIAR